MLSSQFKKEVDLKACNELDFKVLNFSQVTYMLMMFSLLNSKRQWI